MSAAVYHRFADLPWAMPEQEERRYRTILKRTLVVFILFALILPFLPLPQIEREQAEELPPRFAQLLLERQPPPVAKPKEPEAVKPESKPETKKVEPKQKKEPVRTVEAARAKAERSGLLAFKDELSDLRAHAVTSKLEKTPQVVAGSKTVAATTRAPDRSLITASAAAGSGGINTARLSRDTGGDGLVGRGTTQVTSPVGAGAAGGGRLQSAGGGKASRALEEIRLVFDRNKGSIYTIYNRALREDPTLQGKVVVKLTISPAGEVMDCQIVSSELRSPELERKLLARIKQFNFGAKAVEVMVVTYPIDFLPS
jgi:periplasmic protein TonB